MDLLAPRSLGELNRLIAETPPLVAGATQAVLGESPLGALALVGKPVPVMKVRGNTRFGERGCCASPTPRRGARDMPPSWRTSGASVSSPIRRRP